MKHTVVTAVEEIRVEEVVGALVAAVAKERPFFLSPLQYFTFCDH